MRACMHVPYLGRIASGLSPASTAPWPLMASRGLASCRSVYWWVPDSEKLEGEVGDGMGQEGQQIRTRWHQGRTRIWGLFCVWG